jgi:hypothetical protein
MADVTPSSASDTEKRGDITNDDLKAAHHEHIEVPSEAFNALRIDGDDEDHMHEPPMTFKRAMSLLAMAFLWTGSQIPVYLYGKRMNCDAELQTQANRCNSTLYLWRYWRRRQMDLVCSRQPAGFGRRVPLCR